VPHRIIAGDANAVRAEQTTGLLATEIVRIKIKLINVVNDNRSVTLLYSFTFTILYDQVSSVLKLCSQLLKYSSVTDA